ncbi:TRAP transporter small permease [Halanaerobium salsuginis]|uniref:TRAP-type C4-dicarboxylate transport system, small permease component n=1 Tax=Halanaerobium salsuginis TaxID=29563 RepID=A0A1I4JKS0_9FIRM|nr:TRAP transporter small permease [Halanaerobium salsuginis]SFL66696.1 TRAP-type C4-dicarboxylate transport system, small permease component [Halanaerobium salsuginis]
MKVIKWLDNNLEEFLMVMFLILMIFIMGVQVFARYFLNYSLSWSEEISRYLFIWSAFISVSYCTKKCISIKIEHLVAELPVRKKAFAKLVNHTIELIFFVYILYFSVLYVISAVKSGQLSPAFRIPMYYVQAAPLVSFILVIIRIIQRWIIEFKTMMGV